MCSGSPGLCTLSLPCCRGASGSPASRATGWRVRPQDRAACQPLMASSPGPALRGAESPGRRGLHYCSIKPVVILKLFFQVIEFGEVHQLCIPTAQITPHVTCSHRLTLLCLWAQEVGRHGRAGSSPGVRSCPGSGKGMRPTKASSYPWGALGVSQDLH